MLHRTEVIHRTCLARAHTTIRAQHEAEIIRLTGVVNQLRLERDSLLVSARTDKATLRSELEREISNLRHENRKLERERDGAADARADAVVQRDQARRERTAAIAERDNARTEAALHQTIRGEAVTTPTPAGPSTPASADPAMDDSAIRFGLLDLDLPK